MPNSVAAPNLYSNNPLGPRDGFGIADYEQFCQKVQAHLRIRLTDYKVDQMQRRVSQMAKQGGCTSFVEYFSAMQRDANLLKGFLDQMTINVTELMRNKELFNDLAKNILPELVEARKGARLDVWSAGCSYGAEAYTLAMLINELSPVPNYHIKGTDLDLSVLARANSANFNGMDMAGVDPDRRKKFFMSIDENTFMPVPSLRRNMVFEKHDLLADPYPANSCDLILCRNVVIYFTDDAKARIYQGFYNALRPGGVLFVGGTERLGDLGPPGFKLMRPFFYRAIKES